MVRGSLGKLLAASLSITGRCWHHQQQLLRRLSIHEYRGAELKNKYGISVPKGASVSTIEEDKDALKSTFPNVKEHYVDLLIWLSKQVVLSRAHHMFDDTIHRKRTLRSCKTLHANILELGFPLSGKLGIALTDVYSKCGEVSYLRAVFDRLEERNNAAWNSLLSAYSHLGLMEEALHAFRSMHCSSTMPDQFGFAIILSVCSRLVDLNYGKQVHCEVLKVGLDSHAFCEGSLVDMYSKCACLVDARQVFDAGSNPDTICYTNMMAGYIQAGMHQEAVEIFLRMQDMGCKPDQVMIVTIMTAFLRLGRLGDARALLEQMPSANAVAWNTVISGHAQNGYEAEALGLFNEMRRSVKPTRSTLGSVLSAAANLRAMNEGKQVHTEAIRFGLDSNFFVGSSLVNLYAKCSQLEDARKVFDLLNEKNVVIWNAMLSGYVCNGNVEEVVPMFFEMIFRGFKPDEFSFVSVFGACACLGNLVLSRQLHAFIVKNNFEVNLFVGNAIVDMYAKFGELGDAMKEFELICNRDIVSWNSIIVGLVHNKHKEAALNFFRRMIVLDEVAPDETSLATILSACSDIQDSFVGLQIHCLSIKSDLSSNIYVATSLLDFYAKLGDMKSAKSIFLKIPEKNDVLWNALIAGLVQDMEGDEAIALFRQMQDEGYDPSPFTYASILPVCTGPSLIMGKQVHGRILRSGLLCNSSFLGVSLLDMYFKSKEIQDANKLFMELPEEKSMVLWTAMISGHAQNGYSENALVYFWKMRNYNVRPDESTFATLLSACAELAALRDGKEIHGLIFRFGFASYEHAASGLIDMYSKCGDARSSLQVFNELQNVESIISWNSVIQGLAKNGFVNEALVLFQKLEQLKIIPDDVTFLGILTACCHAGLVSEGREFFKSMTEKYGMTPKIDHYACMIDILGRSGNLGEAEKIISSLPFEPDTIIWATFLAACRMHGDELRGKRAADKLIKLDPFSSSPYVLLSNMYAASANWSGAKMMRKLMREKGVQKSPGCSWIALEKETDLLVAAENLPLKISAIHEIRTLL